MDIKQQILECLYSTPSGRDFAFSSSSTDSKERFQNSVADFLKAKKYGEAALRCREVYSAMLDLHDKYPTLFPSIDRLNVEELYGTHLFSGQRQHFSHQANVFLLGLLIYHNFPPLRERIDREMEATTIEIPRNPYGSFRYSGDDKYGEFLYRWRLSSLCHDIGTGIQLCLGDNTKITDTLGRLHFQTRVRSIEELHTFQGQDLLADLDKASGVVKFSQYEQYQQEHPFPDSIHHDHGLMGSLVFLQLMHGAYLRHKDNQISRNNDGTEVFWHPLILSHSIIQIAMTIATHNLDKHPEALQECSSTPKIFDMKRCPLAWLLKIADILQEWDKPKIAGEKADQSVTTNMELSFSDSKISAKNFPEDRKEETRRTVQYFTNPGDTISFL
jgi:hypothetical protein